MTDIFRLRSGVNATRTIGRLATYRTYLVAIACASMQALCHAATIQVTILNDEFVPKNITIAPGDTVEWTNVGGSAHTVDADDRSFSSTANGQDAIPANAKFTHTFPTPGRNPYYCALHGGPGGQDMSGVVRVVDPAANTNPAQPINQSPAANSIDISTAPTLGASAFSDADSGDVHAASQWIVRQIGNGAVVLDTHEDTSHKTSIPLENLSGSTLYGWQVRYKDDRGGWSDYSVETRFTTVASVGETGTGLTATYARFVPARQLISVVKTGLDPKVDFDWGLGKPNASTPANNFFVRWEGQVLPEFTERYRFRVRADGGVRVWVKGVLLIDDWVTGPFPIFRSNVISLEAGIPVPVKVEYFDTLGAASMSLRWSSRSQETEVIPQSRLFPTAL